ncbi:MAG: GNAT family N-acetyltransferase [Clostridia bacterium]|nr:GNAT family N-acetyltransferase [Clostridia bacterium]
MPHNPTDMLVRLYDLPETGSPESLAALGDVSIRRAMHIDRDRIVEYVATHFSAGWRSECQAAFSRQPASMFIAVREREIVGFACYDCTAKGMFGPTGVTAEFRGRGIGTGLLRACLLAMRDEGYAYAAIGWVTDALEFYTKTVGAVPIPDSHPGIYRRMIGMG